MLFSVTSVAFLHKNRMYTASEHIKKHPGLYCEYTRVFNSKRPGCIVGKHPGLFNRE